MECDQCEVLRRVFRDLEEIYDNAQGRFGALTESSDADAFNKARKWLNEVRLEYEVARIELERHQRLHATKE